MVGTEPSLVEKIIAVHAALKRVGVGHAFGGALALAYYTHEPRATAAIDVNVELASGDARAALVALPFGVTWADSDIASIERHDQVRLWWGRTPIDLFFRASSFHDEVAERTNLMPFADEELPFLSANDLAVFKSLFDRPKDWLDIAAMAESGALSPAAASTLESLIGADGRVERLRQLVAAAG